MDEIQRLMKLRILHVAAAALMATACSPRQAGDLNYTWQPIDITASLDAGTNDAALDVISQYDSLVAPLQEIIGYSEDVYTARRPESGLSNFAADVIRESAEKYIGEPVQVGITNFGGIRTDLPKGAVRVYDIYSIFPFNNYIVVMDIKGSDLRRTFEAMIAGHRTPALSGVRIEADNTRMTSCLVDGEPIDDGKVYKLATTDFLLNGGDYLLPKDIAVSVQNTDVVMRDMYVEYIKEMTAAGRKLDLKPDGRLSVINFKKNEE